LKDWKETLIRKCSILWITFFLLFTAAAHAQVTSLSLFSDPGDFVGGGQNAFFTPADGTFSAQVSPDGNIISVHFVGQPGVFWDLQFSGCCNSPLTLPGGYFAAGLPGQTFNAGMLISGDGRTCDSLFGTFDIQQLSFNADGSIASLDIDFVQQCQEGNPALSGEIRFNATAPLLLSAPPHRDVTLGDTLTVQVTAFDAQGAHVALTAPLPAGDIQGTFVDHGDNTGTYTWTPNSTFAGVKLFFEFQGTDSAGNFAFTPIEIDVIGSQTQTPQPPPNDDFSHATVVPSVPFTTSQDITNATVAPDDPFCVSRNQTVWFAFTPTQNMRLEANTLGSNYDTTLGVYTGTRGALNQIGCDDDSNATLQSTVRFDAVAGVTYYFEVSSFSLTTGNLVFNLVPGPTPLAITPSVIKFGTIDPTTGTATISGSVSCTKQAFVTLSGQLKQTHGNTPITGFFSVFLPCDGITPWNTTIQTAPTLFHGRSVALFTGGKADISATATAFDFDSGEAVQQNLAVTITLRGKN